MQVKIRLQRFGNKKRPYYRIVASASIMPRDGRFLEILGLYHPIASEENQLTLDKDKVISWLEKGANPSAQVKNILQNQGIWKEFADAKEKRRVARVKKSRLNKKAKKGGVSTPEPVVVASSEE